LLRLAARKIESFKSAECRRAKSVAEGRAINVAITSLPANLFTVSIRSVVNKPERARTGVKIWKICIRGPGFLAGSANG
jgi:hypothetical protein